MKNNNDNSLAVTLGSVALCLTLGAGDAVAVDSVFKRDDSNLTAVTTDRESVRTSGTPLSAIPLGELKTAHKWCHRTMQAVIAHTRAKRTVAPEDVTVFGSSGEYSCQTVIDEMKLRAF